MNVWDAEHALDAEQARGMLRAQFPALELASVEFLADGFDNTVFLVDGTWAVRFPRREVAVTLLAKETALLPTLAPRLPLPVPVPELVGEAHGGYPWPFWGGRMLPGVEIADAGLPDADRRTLARGVGAFLRALHDPQLAADLGGGLEVDPMRRALPAARGVLGREALSGLAALGVWKRDTALDRAVDDLFTRGAALGPPTGEPVLVHGDFHLRHVLVGPDGAASGVIDWGDACLGDPALDVSFAFAALDAPARSAFLDAYGREVDAERELRARVLAAALCASLAEYASVEDRPALLAEALAGVRRAVS